MIVKCPNCGAALEYDVITGHMYCQYCCSYFNMDDKVDRLVGNNEKTAEKSDENTEKMELQIYNCNACGAELAINGVESSTFCAYCGQPTIVFDRVAMRKKPKYIVPFKVRREHAETLIREKLKKGIYVPDDIKNFKVEKLRGIYVPYYNVDEDYSDRQIIRGKVKRGKSTCTRYYYRSASDSFTNIPVDASKTFDNESSQRLEPFVLGELIDFDEKYLSGFYSDCSDEGEADIKYMATQRVKALFDSKMLETVNASDKKIVNSMPVSEIKKMDYILLPVWFLVFKNEGKTYTMLVNGQTGKVVGAVPAEKKKVVAHMSLLSVVSSFLFAIILAPFLTNISFDSETFAKFIMMLLVILFIIIVTGYEKLKAYKRSVGLTTNVITKKYMSDRTSG